ncbi:tRNA A37 threonylcarbamoyladenosine dehydratase [Desulfitispora alkaliphila]|uniref:tRNA threonylcarbamoyladenosine dehydratase n=1 Tax=Desulfitispora alkaliphila TaxID=622674 RepID=UPI003D1B3D3A
MVHKFSRTELLIGEKGINMLGGSRIAIFGIGGVGSFTAEALARAGVGQFILVDYDDICMTNINRQIHALHTTVGQMKVEAMKERILEINPDAIVITHKKFVDKDNIDQLLANDCDYVVDAIDTVTSKLLLIEKALELGLPIVSSMGAGNKLSARGFQVADISETKVCPLAKIMRKELRKRGINKGVKVVFSLDETIKLNQEALDCKEYCSCTTQETDCTKKRQIPGSISYVPSVAGLMLAGEVVQDLLKINENS